MSTDNVFCTPEYDGLLENLEAAKKRVRDEARTAVGSLFTAFFAAHNQFTGIKWTQYTPYFNDGEPCTFRVNTDFAARINNANDGGDEDDGFLYSWDIDDGATKEALRALERAVNEDVFQAAFGDHAEIIATRNGFDVTEYSHD